MQQGHFSKISESALREMGKKIAPFFTPGERDDIEALIILMKYKLNPEHLKKGIAFTVIPSKKRSTNISTLLTYFDTINFTRPRGSHYYNPFIEFREDYGAIGDNHDRLQRTLRDQLELFIKRVKDKIPYSGTPSAGSSALYDFYTTIENALGNVIEKIDSIRDQEERAYIIADTIIHILRAASHCGPRIHETAIKRYHVRCLGRKADDIEAVYDLASEFRGIIAESRLPPLGSETILYYSNLVRSLGEEFNLPGWEILANNHSPYGSEAFKKERDRKRFFAFYNAATSASWITKGMKKEDLITLCGNYIPHSFEPEVIVKARETISALKREGKNEQEIKQALQSQYEIYFTPAQSAEEVVASERKGMYLESVTAVDAKGKYSIKPEAILEALHVAEVLMKV